MVIHSDTATAQHREPHRRRVQQAKKQQHGHTILFIVQDFFFHFFKPPLVDIKMISF